MKVILLVLLVFSIVLVNTNGLSQEVTDTKSTTEDEIRALKEQLKALKEAQEIKLKELEDLINGIKEKIESKEQEDELNKLLEEAQQLTTVEKQEEAGVGKKFHSGVRQQSGLNPNISVSGDFFSGYSSDDVPFVKQPGNFSYGNNGFFLRELELNLIAPLDPFTRGKTFMSVTESEISIEEAYMEWLNLPLKMNLKIGLFNSEFGILNRYHDHALPQFDRPKVLTNLFTNANMGGFGVAGNFMLEPLFMSDASSLDLTVINGGTGQSFTDAGRYNLLYSANMTNFYDVTANTFFEWRLSGVTGYNDPVEEHRSYIGNLAFNVKWVPQDRAKYRAVDWKTEILYSRRETNTGPIGSLGFYTSLQNKVNARWWLTGRVGYSELPYDNNQYEWDCTACADFWQSDFVFIRFQYQYSKREFTNILNFAGMPNYTGPFPRDSAFIVQVNWAMGPHKHTIY
ncbi:hypothetical protein ACFL5P_00790 [candidate division KSB1 bacterium]